VKFIIKVINFKKFSFNFQIFCFFYAILHIIRKTNKKRNYGILQILIKRDPFVRSFLKISAIIKFFRKISKFFFLSKM